MSSRAKRQTGMGTKGLEAPAISAWVARNGEEVRCGVPKLEGRSLLEAWHPPIPERIRSSS